MDPKRTSGLIVLVSLASILAAQYPSVQEKDSIRVTAGRVIYYPDGEVYADQDTVILLNPDTNYTIAPCRTGNGTGFIDSLKVRAFGTDWTYRLHNIIIRNPKNTAITDTLRTERSSGRFVPYQGKIVRKILIRQLPPFGPGIHDTSVTAATMLEEMANEIHVPTQLKTIGNNLLFEPGDRIDPYLIGDNERILRRLSFIVDARIIVHETDLFSDSADVTILIKDAFPLGLGGEISDLNSGKLELFNNNILGYGHEFHLLFHWDGDHHPWLGNEFYYRNSNIAGTFINSRIRYKQAFETENFEMELDRRFFTHRTRYAGAFMFERTKALHNLTYDDTLSLPTPVKYNRYDSWLGRSFYLGGPAGIIQKQRTNLVLSARHYNEYYFSRPEVSDSIFYDYHNKNVLLSSLALSRQSFFSSNLIYSFGRTEDIPQGMMVSLTAGSELSEFNTRWYAGVNLLKGGYLGNYGYLFADIGYGGFIEKVDFIEQGVIHAQADYFTNLFIVNRFKFRHFISINYVRGVRRLEDELINISDLNGIRGFKIEDEKGTHKLTLNYEAVAFSPYYFYGFRFVFFGFADMGLVGPDTKPVFRNRLHSGLGVGLRFRNERLVFETIQIRLGYYPTLADAEFPFGMDIAGEKRLTPRNFFVKKPEIIRFE